MFDRLERGNFFAVHEGEGVADVLGATGPADAMDVIFGVLGHVVVNDMTDTGNVEPPRGNVGRHHDFVFTAFKTFERFNPLPLGAIGMQNGDGMISLFQSVSDPIGAVLRSAKN